MLIERLQVKGLLSFGPKGIDLELEPLNVLIGPNGSGKSNLLATLALLRATTGDLGAYLDATGGEDEWFWQGSSSSWDWTTDPIIGATIRFMAINRTLHHGLTPFTYRESKWVIEEEIQRRDEDIDEVVSVHSSNDSPLPDGFTEGQSVLSQVDCLPDSYEIRWLRDQYAGIRLYRNWTFGARASTRRAQSATLAGNFLAENTDNLANVIAGFSASRRERLTYYLRRFYDRVVGVSTPVRQGNVALVIEESGGVEMPASRLSDGTLRYLSLLAVLLDPEPPPLIGIEEPELGLHPDIIPDIAKLMIEASERTQLVVTTHSPIFVDELTERPSSIVACEHYDGETHCHRVNPESLKAWQGERGLAEVWSMGGIGGNRW